MDGWITNDLEVAATLRSIDDNYKAARAAAVNLPLLEKVEAYRKAREVRDEAYAELQRR